MLPSNIDTNEYQIRLLIQMLQETRKALPRRVDISFLLKGTEPGLFTNLFKILPVSGLSCNMNIRGLPDLACRALVLQPDVLPKVFPFVSGSKVLLTK